MNHKAIHFLILSILLSACSSHKSLTSIWQEESLNIPCDLPRTEYQYASDDQLFYRISNDDDFLYVNLKVDDQNVQKRLLMNGFTIWIDSSASSKKYMGLKYQVDPNKMLMKPEEIQRYLPLDENGKKRSLLSYLLKNTQQELIGIQTLSDDIKYHLVQDSSRSLNFSLALPIKHFSSKRNTFPVISLILVSKAPEDRRQSPQGQSPQMGMSNGGGRSGGGTRGGGGRGERAQSQAQSHKVKDIQIEVKKLQLSNHE